MEFFKIIKLNNKSSIYYSDIPFDSCKSETMYDKCQGGGRSSKLTKNILSV